MTTCGASKAPRRRRTDPPGAALARLRVTGRATRAPVEDVDEAAIGDGTEERLAGQSGAARRRARDAAEKAGALSRRPEGIGVRGLQRAERILVDERIERGRRRGLRKLLSLPAEAEAAMPAGLVAALA